jgi:hypothetical protein
VETKTTEFSLTLPNRTKKVIKSPEANARQTIGKLESGCAIIGVTKGQFSLLDLAKAVSEQVGPAALTLSTWSIAIKDDENIRFFKNTKRFTDCRLLIDRSFPSRHPKYVDDVIQTWGGSNIRICRNHAKFFMLRNEKWNICVRSSMNMNRNPRLEQFDLDDSFEICEFIEGIVNDAFEKMPRGMWISTSTCDDGFEKMMK